MPAGNKPGYDMRKARAGKMRKRRAHELKMAEMARGPKPGGVEPSPASWLPVLVEIGESHYVEVPEVPNMSGIVWAVSVGTVHNDAFEAYGLLEYAIERSWDKASEKKRRLAREWAEKAR